MILSASLEFEKKYNSEIAERSSDEYEMPQVRNKSSINWYSYYILIIILLLFIV